MGPGTSGGKGGKLVKGSWSWMDGGWGFGFVTLETMPRAVSESRERREGVQGRCRRRWTSLSDSLGLARSRCALNVW